MTVPHRVFGWPYSVNPEEKLSAPVAYTRRSLAIVGLIIVGCGLIVAGLWVEFGWPIGLVALGVVFVAAAVGGGKAS